MTSFYCIFLNINELCVLQMSFYQLGENRGFKWEWFHVVTLDASNLMAKSIDASNGPLIVPVLILIVFL